MSSCVCLTCWTIVRPDLDTIKLQTLWASAALARNELKLQSFEWFQDSEYFNSMCYIRDNDPVDLDLYFSIEEDYFGEVSQSLVTSETMIQLISTCTSL